MTDRLTGSCHCGTYRFSLPADSVGVIACHCEDCRKMHGNYNVMIAVAADDLVFEGGVEPHWYQSSDKARRAFCPTCGGRLMKENVGSGRYLVSAGLINGPTGKRIIKNVFEQSKGDWYDLPVVST